MGKQAAVNEAKEQERHHEESEVDNSSFDQTEAVWRRCSARRWFRMALKILPRDSFLDLRTLSLSAVSHALLFAIEEAKAVS